MNYVTELELTTSGCKYSHTICQYPALTLKVI